MRAGGLRNPKPDRSYLAGEVVPCVRRNPFISLPVFALPILCVSLTLSQLFYICLYLPTSFVLPSVLQGFPLPRPNLCRVSPLPTSSPTPRPSCISPTMDTSLLLSVAPPAAIWMPAQPWKLGPVCWRAVHCGIWPTVPDQRDLELTCLQDPRGTSQAPVTQVDAQSNPWQCVSFGAKKENLMQKSTFLKLQNLISGLLSWDSLCSSCSIIHNYLVMQCKSF